jgi:hypothetical protein
MNSATSKTTLSDLALLIALELPGNWTPKNREDINRAELVRADGLRLVFISGGGWAPSGKVHVTFSRPRDAKNGHIDIYGDAFNGGPINQRITDPSINVSLSKSAEQIANDIARRLMPESERIFALVNERINSANAYEISRDALTQRVCDAIHGKNWVLSKYEQESRKLSLGGVESGSGYGDVRIDSGDSVTFSLSSIPADKAVELVQFLQSHTFASPATAKSAS